MMSSLMGKQLISSKTAWHYLPRAAAPGLVLHEAANAVRPVPCPCAAGPGVQRPCRCYCNWELGMGRVGPCPHVASTVLGWGRRQLLACYLPYKRLLVPHRQFSTAAIAGGRRGEQEQEQLSGTTACCIESFWLPTYHIAKSGGTDPGTLPAKGAGQKDGFHFPIASLLLLQRSGDGAVLCVHSLLHHAVWCYARVGGGSTLCTASCCSSRTDIPLEICSITTAVWSFMDLLFQCHF